MTGEESPDGRSGVAGQSLGGCGCADRRFGRGSKTLATGLGTYHFGDYRKLELSLLLIDAGLVRPRELLSPSGSKGSELIGRYRVGRGKGHGQRVSGR